MTPADRLAPCPFCGIVPEVFPGGEGGTGTMVECVTPGCVNPHVSYYGDGVAVAKWNRRVVSPTDPDSMGAKILRAQTMKQQGEPVWLIERGQPENQSPTIWWRGLQDGRGDFGILEGWTTDANLAKPFPTKADAEEFIGDHEHPVSGPQSHRLWRERATEHLFMSGPTDPDLRARIAREFADELDAAAFHVASDTPNCACWCCRLRAALQDSRPEPSAYERAAQEVERASREGRLAEIMAKDAAPEQVAVQVCVALAHRIRLLGAASPPEPIEDDEANHRTPEGA